MSVTANSSSTSSGSHAVIVRGRPLPPGNPGRPAGSRNRSTVVAEALLEGEAEEPTRKGVERAKAGDPTMLKFFLERLVRRDRYVRIDLPPLETAEDGVEGLAVIARAVSEGDITPTEGASLSMAVEAFVRSIDFVELMHRVEALEAEVKSILE